MKIAIFVPGGVDRSGVDRVIPCNLWLIERLARAHEVHVFAMRQEPEPAEWDLLGARIHNIGYVKGYRRRLLRRFREEHKRGPFDIVHAFFGGTGPLAAVAGRRHGVPVLFQPSGGELVALPEIEYGLRRTWRGRLALRVSVAGARRVSVATPYMQTLASRLGIQTQRIAMGVALDRWPAAAPRPRLAHERVHLLHIGDIQRVKDQRTLLAAAAHMRDAGLDFELDIAGIDTMGGMLQRVAAAHGLEHRVRWHGVLRRGALRALVDRSHLLLVTSRHEAGPLVVLEAAIAGVPTVGTAVGHVIEWAPEGAVAVPVADAEAMAREAIALLGDEPRRLAIATVAQRRALAIDADYTAAAFERTYKELVSEGLASATREQ